VPARVHALVEDRKKLEREVADLRRKLASGGGAGAGPEPVKIGEVQFLAVEAPGMAPGDLKSLVDEQKKKLGSGIVAVASASPEGKLGLVVGVTADLTGHSARSIWCGSARRRRAARAAADGRTWRRPADPTAQRPARRSLQFERQSKTVSDATTPRFAGTENYIATPDLNIAVNAAVALQRPLLVKGEPGTGKTVLAHEIAAALGAPLIEWHVKSTTKAQHGLYEYDAVKRLRDGQLGDPRVQDIGNYIVRGKVWEAFVSPKRPVLLIDEIDKADIEFPNDLLLELDRMEFFVYETQETGEGDPGR
jgi:hypothetical protein